MLPKLLVVDTSVFVKLFLDEPDAATSRQFFTQAVQRDIQLLAPQLLQYEALNVAEYRHYSIAHVLELITAYKSFNLHLIEPTAEHWQKALEITQHGHQKSGYPSIADSIFHAMAIVEDTVFVTADKRHMRKTHTLGHIQLVANIAQ